MPRIKWHFHDEIHESEAALDVYIMLSKSIFLYGFIHDLGFKKSCKCPISWLSLVTFSRHLDIL